MLSRPKYLIHYSESFRNQSSPMELKSRTARICIQWLQRHKHWHRTSTNSTKILHAPHNRKINPYRGPAARLTTKNLEKFHQQNRKLRQQQISSRKPVSPKKGTELLVMYTGQMKASVASAHCSLLTGQMSSISSSRSSTNSAYSAQLCIVTQLSVGNPTTAQTTTGAWQILKLSL